LGFLEADDEFRQETGAVPSEFEVRVPDSEVAGVRLSGRADRIDRTPDGTKAWVIDYKTGSTFGFDKIAKGDPLLGGRKLQLPVYRLAAVDAAEIQALYWFITHKRGFERIAFPMTPENLDRFERTIQAIVEGIGSGAFPAKSGEEDEHSGGWDNCNYCDFDRICSRRRDQDYAEMSEDTTLRPWQQIAEVARATEVGP
jgi:CRISPR/Cas system-associated exonuclease Cas4 (RecB family)